MFAVINHHSNNLSLAVMFAVVKHHPSILSVAVMFTVIKNLSKNLSVTVMFFVSVAQKKASNVLFDEEDILGSMGLDSPPPASRKASLISGDFEANRPARSVLDDLLAPKSDRGSVMKEKKTSSNPMEDFMSSLKSSS